MLETDPPSQSKKRRLGDVDKDEMNETMMNDKDIIISNLTKEIEMLKADAFKTKVGGEAYKNDLGPLKKDAQDKEWQASYLQQKNEQLSLKEIEMDRKHKDERRKLQEQNANVNILLAERESALDETLQRLTDMNNIDDNNLDMMIEEKLTTELETRFKSLQDTLTASI